MHRTKHITHRDIKLENILCMPQENEHDDVTVKLTDFGFACHFTEKSSMDVALGSPMYMSPELTCEEDYDERVDTWSTGVLTYILLCGVPPFYD